MNNKKKSFILILCVLFLIAMAGCSQTGAQSFELSEYDNGVQNEPAVAENTQADETVPEAKSGTGADSKWIEVYRDYLTENSEIFTSDDQYMPVGNGKIAVMDVYGDEIPELLYIYCPPENGYAECLKILTYSEADGLVSIYDTLVYMMAGGGDNYCVYLTDDGDLMVYYASHNQYSFYGFWPVDFTPDSKYDIDEQYYYMQNTDLAELFFGMYYGEPDEVPTYTQYGKDISETDFNKAAKDIMGNISFMIFQSILPDGLGLYERDELWTEVEPFDEHCMTYSEAISFLG